MVGSMEPGVIVEWPGRIKAHRLLVASSDRVYTTGDFLNCVFCANVKKEILMHLHIEQINQLHLKALLPFRGNVLRNGTASFRL